MSRYVPPHLLRAVDEIPSEAISLAGDLPAGWVPVASSWVGALRYDRERGTFDLTTRAGKTYTDWPNGLGCTPEAFRELLVAPSKGSWLAKHYPKSPKR